MNLNSLILTNIQSSTYFKGERYEFSLLQSFTDHFPLPLPVSLFKLKTYHEVIDEIYYQVKHMEPWEKGSRKTSGQTGMCGGVRSLDQTNPFLFSYSSGFRMHLSTPYNYRFAA